MLKKKKHSIIFSLKNSLDALIFIVKNERPFLYEILIAIVLIPLAFYVAKDLVEFLVLIFPIFLVMICEIFNTAIETIVDRIGYEYHQLSKIAKDLGSLAVVFGLLLLFIVWIVKIIYWLKLSIG